MTGERKYKKSKNKIIPFTFSTILMTGIITCLICDLSISGSLTWSLISVSSICFAWLLIFPGIILGKDRVAVSLISLSIFVVPYLYLLSILIRTEAIFSIGSATAVVSIVFLWITYAVFRLTKKERKSVALGIIFLLAIPFVFVINVILSKMISEPVCDMWDLLTFFIMLISAVICFSRDTVNKKSDL